MNAPVDLMNLYVIATLFVRNSMYLQSKKHKTSQYRGQYMLMDKIVFVHGTHTYLELLRSLRFLVAGLDRERLGRDTHEARDSSQEFKHVRNSIPKLTCP